MCSAARIPRLLSIAGSDSGGGAGIQADLKAFAACGAHGMTAITAITAQNTVGVDTIHSVPPEMVLAQVRAVVSDIGVDAVKIGMLGDQTTVAAVADALELLPDGTPVVLDPVMVSESGAELLSPAARRAVVERLLPRVTVVTPNLPEARALVAVAAELGLGLGEADGHAGRSEGSVASGEGPGGMGASTTPDRPDDVDDDAAAAHARAIHALGPRVVIVTGGHRDLATDVFFDGTRLVEIPGERHPDGAAHGSGCTHSSVLAARLGAGEDPLTAARTAKELASRAVADGLASVGAGPGPVDVLGLGVRDSTIRRDRRGVLT